MDYNTKQIDKDLALLFKSKEGDELKKTLRDKIAEQERMLDAFKTSIMHCDSQIQLCNASDPIKKNEANKVIFEDNKRIWNISGFINLISMDIKTIQYGMYFAETEWHKRFYARHACTIMYESAKDIFELLGKEFKNLISNRINIEDFEDELKDIRLRLNQFQGKNSVYLSLVRNNTSAHKEKDVLKQLEIITDINWSDTINTTMEFEKIINDLGVFLQKLIPKGLESLKEGFSD